MALSGCSASRTSPRFLAMRGMGLGCTLLLTACAADGLTAPELAPAPSGRIVGCDLTRGGIGMGEPIAFIVDGKRVTEEEMRAIDTSHIDTIEVRRMTAANPVNEVHITLRPPRL